MVKFGLIPDEHHHHTNSSSNSSGSSTPRHFFIPILSTPSSTTTPQPFCIPKAFLKYLQVGKKKIKKGKSHKKREVLEAILRSNGRGKSFHVNMIMDKDGRLMSDDEHEQNDQQVEEDVQQTGGWQAFCDCHDLHMGDFLLFRHLGSLSFDVIVFDSTTCQRKYPPLDPPFFFDHMNTGKSSKTTTTPGQAKRADADADAAAIENSDDNDKPSNQFTTTLKHYTFSQWLMTLPAKFVRSNGLGNKNCTITFRDEKKRSWPISLRYKKCNGEVYICGGWRQFIEGNGLKEGDVCTFELVSRRGTKNIILDVHRGSKTTTPVQAKRADADGGAAAGSLNDYDTPSSQFNTTLKHYNFSQWTMSIPMEFARSNGLGNKTCTITFIDEKGRSWPIELRYKKSRDQVYVRGGWREFIEGNGLKEGDVCTFELVYRRGKTKNIVFDVRRDFKTTTPDQAKRADADADAAASGRSSNDDDTPSNQFTTPLKHYSFIHWRMTLPAKFVRSNGLGHKNCAITFRDGKKRSWPIDLRYKKSSGEVYIYGGWRQFIEGNGLKEGDVCTFELVSRRGTKNIIFDVHRGSKTTTPGQANRADADGAAATGSSNENTPSNKFTTRLKHYNFSKWTMTIPAGFVRSNGLGKKNCTITFKDEKGRSWPMNLKIYGSGQVNVHGGWRQFIKGNDLEEGDVCTFELVSQRGGTKNIVFDFYRGSKGTAPDQAKRADVDAAAGSFDDDDDRPPNQFTTSLKRYNFRQWAMNFPTEFVRSNGLCNKTCTVTFRDEKGRLWPMGLRYKKSSGQVYVRGGWRQFIRGNGLKKGDVCTFELVSRRGTTKNIVFDVRRGHH